MKARQRKRAHYRKRWAWLTGDFYPIGAPVTLFPHRFQFFAKHKGV